MPAYPTTCAPRLLLPALLAVVMAAAPAGAEAPDVEGLWTGEIRHNGQSADFAVTLAATSDSTLTLGVSLPPIDAWDLTLGTATVRGDTVRLGDWTLSHDPGKDLLGGTLPGFLVPVHAIPFSLARADSLPRPRVAPPACPAAAPVWERDLGTVVWAALAVDQGTVFAGCDDGSVTAMRADDGALVWKTSTGGAVRARPTPDGTRIYVHSDDGYLYCLRRGDGGVQWRTRIANAPTDRIPPGQSGSRYDHYASSPTPTGDSVYVGSADGRVHAVAAADGRILWTFAARDAVTATPTVSRERVLCGSFDGRVYALDPSDGHELWSHDTGAPVVAAAAAIDGLAVVGSRSYDLLALDAATGERRWKHYVWFSWIESAPVARDGTVYVGTSDAQQLIALSLTERAPLWTFDTGGSVWAAPALTADTVYAGSIGVAGYIVDHEATFWAIDRADGRARWRYAPGRPGDDAVWGFGAAPAADDARVYAATLDGRVLAFRR